MIAALRLFAFSVPGVERAERNQSRVLRHDRVVPPAAADLDDRTLLTRLARGEEAVARAAFESLFHRHTPRMYASAIRGVCADEPALAEDAVQAVMIRIWERRTELPDIDNLAAYLVRATARECLALKRTHQRAAVRETSVVDLNEGDAEQTIETRLVDDELSLLLRRAIDAIPGRTGVLFRAWYGSEDTYDGVARRLGVSAQAVVQARLRAIAQLRANPELSRFFSIL